MDITGIHINVAPMLDKEVIPLRFESGHHSNVHRSWPAAVVNRSFDLASQPSMSHAHSLIDKYVRCNASAPTLSLMRQAVANRNRRKKNVSHVSSHSSCQPRPYWLKLGYHPVLPKVVSLALKLKGPEGMLVRPSWKNRIPMFLARIGGHNRPLMSTRSNGWLLGKDGGSSVCDR